MEKLQKLKYERWYDECVCACVLNPDVEKKMLCCTYFFKASIFYFTQQKKLWQRSPLFFSPPGSSFKPKEPEFLRVFFQALQKKRVKGGWTLEVEVKRLLIQASFSQSVALLLSLSSIVLHHQHHLCSTMVMMSHLLIVWILDAVSIFWPHYSPINHQDKWISLLSA